MKRSEMVRIMAIAHSRFDCCGHPYDYDDLADYVLSSIEEAGMLPPKSLDTITLKKGLVRGYTMMFEWEPEDDE